ncbi:hypothetical protein C8Q79DRAFT_972931 [Trametes meyenii]|nr:hypothetical protein C8Q79DRAFT_972931 [Trametes meyenii]
MTKRAHLLVLRSGCYPASDGKHFYTSLFGRCNHRHRIQGGVMANLNPAGHRGTLLGASSMVFSDQKAVDIYFQDYWQTVGTLRRVAVVCVAWGLSIAFVERAVVLEAGNPGPWGVAAGALHRITVHDQGLHPSVQQQGGPLVPPGHLPNIPPGQPLQPTGLYMVNGIAVQGHHIPWHHRVVLHRTAAQPQNNRPLHYHQHRRRVNHGPTPPRIKQNGSHRIFTTITYSTQVQNYRRIVEVLQPAAVEHSDSDSE